jgi:SMC interacting uncharacterized protein involved in chromosome segregation
MTEQTATTHFFLNWAKERIDEMDAALSSVEGKLGEVKAELRIKAEQAIKDLRKKRDEFREYVKKQAQSNEAAWTSAKTQLEADWSRFESEVQTYVERFGQQINQQQATFKLQADAQLKAWREAADKFDAAASDFARERRGDIDATVTRMKAEAAIADKKLKNLQQAGNESWSVLMGALTETRAVFDRANQSAREVFKKSAA